MMNAEMRALHLETLEVEGRHRRRVRRDIIRWTWMVLFGLCIGYVVAEGVENFPTPVVEVSP